jgi:hypothetical protein
VIAQLFVTLTRAWMILICDELRAGQVELGPSHSDRLRLEWRDELLVKEIRAACGGPGWTTI